MANVVLMDTSEIERRLGLELDGEGQKFFTNTAYETMDKYVPMDSTNLRRDVTLTPHSITYEVPYAYPQYIGIVNGNEVKNYTTKNTSSYWDKRMTTAEKDDIVEAVARNLSRRFK